MLNKKYVMKNIDFIILEFDSKIIKHIKENNYNDFLDIIKYLYNRNIKDYSSFEKHIRSKANENKIKIWKNNRFSHDNIDTIYLKGSAFRGKKRKEHSEYMKIKMIDVANNRSEKHKENLIYFHQKMYQKRRLFKNNIINENELNTLSDIEIKKKYNFFLGNLMKGDKYKKNYVMNLLNSKKYLDNEIWINWKFQTDLSNIDKNIDNFYLSAMSCVSTISSMDENNNMGSTNFFKRDELKGLKYQKNKKDSIKVKSSYESKSILFFEENKIQWEYEFVRISYDNGKFYTPDFRVILNDEEYIIEIKGYIRNQKHKNKIEKQINNLNKIYKNVVYIKKPINCLNDIYNNILEKKHFKP